MRYEAHERNRVATNALPETFVDHAEEIWALLAETTADDEKVYTQSDVANMLGEKWSRGKVSQYAALENINLETWELVATNFQTAVASGDNGEVANNATMVALSERLLRDITCLQPDHQHELVSDLIKGEITKGKFKTLAQLYKARDEAALYVWGKLSRKTRCP